MGKRRHNLNRHKWNSGLRRCSQNQKVPSLNPTGTQSRYKAPYDLWIEVNKRGSFLTPNSPLLSSHEKADLQQGYGLVVAKSHAYLKKPGAKTCKYVPLLSPGFKELRKVMILFYLPCSTYIFMSLFISISAACIFCKTNLVYVKVVQNSFYQMVLWL